MRASLKPFVFIALTVAALLCICAGHSTAEEYYYGIEVNGVLCGYSKIETSPMVEDGAELILIKHEVFLMLSALGSEFNSEVKLTYHYNPETGRFTYHDSVVDQGQLHLDSKIYIDGNEARCTSSLSDKENIIELPPDAVLENTLIFDHLKRDFVEGGLNEKSYAMFEVREEEMQTSTFTKTGMEKLDLAGRSYDAIVLDRLSKATGLKVTMWIDTETGIALKTVYPNNRMSYLADESVMKKIELANLDDSIASRVNVAIADVPGIAYMKVKAKVEPTGLWITPESLSVPGQSFTGTVNENVVEGIFEIEHPRYDGSGAPPFPPNFKDDESLRPYLEAEEFLESDDPVLTKKAEEITGGSADSWEAACRLSKWVSDNISYAIPGGGTARKTYDIRAGECGAHSMLVAAFCRSLGIPARVVWGCMYIPNFGGAFGQHGWNEIYMGEAGWIPVDATATETDFVDSGHIRIGVYESPVTALNPIEMEILDYRVGSGSAEGMAAATQKYASYVGEYRHHVSGDAFKVLVQDGSLAVDIPNKMVLAFDDPDDEGKWKCKLSGSLFCTFGKDEHGDIVELYIHELVPLRRQSDPEGIEEDVPDELRPYLGKYLLAQLNAVFTVLYKDGGLAVHDTLEDKTVKLQPSNEKGGWVNEYGKNTVYFEKGDDGSVTSMTIDSTSRFIR